MSYKYGGKLREVATPRTKAKCGTDSGYHTHIRLKTTMCEPCRAAHSKAMKAYHRRPTMQATCGTYPGYMRHKRAGEDSCNICKAAYAQYMRDYRAQKQAA